MTTRLQTVFVALGANLGNAREVVRNVAQDLMALSSGENFVASSLWSTEPIGFDEVVPEFINAMVRFDTPLAAVSLLDEMQRIEADYGRFRQSVADGSVTADSGAETGPVGRRVYQSRTIDLDIIDYGGQIVRSPRLVVPHPRAFERLFVLLPMYEIDPDFRIAGMTESLGTLIDRAEPMRIVKVDSMLCG